MALTVLNITENLGVDLKHAVCARRQPVNISDLGRDLQEKWVTMPNQKQSLSKLATKGIIETGFT